MAISLIGVVEKQFSVLRTKQRNAPLGGGPTSEELAEFNAMCVAAIDRMTIRGDAYSLMAYHELGRSMLDSLELALALNGIVRSLKRDIRAGSLLTLGQTARSDLLGDFLDIAEGHLRHSRVAPAAAVTVAVLEVRLWQLAARYEIPDSTESALGTTVRRELWQVNEDLAQIAYGQDDRRAVARWLDVHSRVTRGDMSRVSWPIVEDLVNDVRSFIAEYPA